MDPVVDPVGKPRKPIQLRSKLTELGGPVWLVGLMIPPPLIIDE